VGQITATIISKLRQQLRAEFFNVFWGTETVS